MTDKITFDTFAITPDEGTELCLHYLRMAARFFEVSPDDRNQSLQAEMARLSLDEGEKLAIEAFIKSQLEFHEGLKKKWPL